MGGGGRLKLPRCVAGGENGAKGVQSKWHDHFAETPDVLKVPGREQTIVPVLDIEIGGDEFVTMAGPCSVETEFQLMATAHHVRRAGARILRGGAFKPRSSPYSFQGLGLEGLKMLAHAREETGHRHRDRGDERVRRAHGGRIRGHSADRLPQHGELLAAGSGGAFGQADSAEARHGGHHRRFPARGTVSPGQRQSQCHPVRAGHPHV